MKLKIKVGLEEYEIDITHNGDVVRLERGGRLQEVTVRERTGERVVLEHNGRLIRLVGSKNGDKRQLWVNGRIVTYERVQKRSGRGGGTQSGSLTATIPAVVSEVLVNVGDEVKAGDKLILLESMKMIIPIQAPTDGTVQAILCTAGDSVQPGVPLVVVE